MTQKINRLELAQKAHAASVAKGFWDEKYSPEHFLMLVITELSEAVEAHRDGRVTTRRTIDEYIKDSRGEFSPELFKSRIKDSVADELADAYIRLLDLAGGFGYDIELKDPKTLNYKELLECVSKHSFVEGVFNVAGGIGFQKIDEVIHEGIPYLLSSIEALAEFNNIDLAWHITEKMRYNETRPAKHGKEY